MKPVVILAGLSLLAPSVAFAACTPGTSKVTGPLKIENGELVGANGVPFLARGVNDANVINDVDQLLATYPGLNFVRVPVYNFTDPEAYQAAIQKLTAAGVVVLLENHTSSDGKNRGGGAGEIFSGPLLQQDLDWYRAVGADYGSNPLVIAASTNEPPSYDLAALSDWQRQEYDAFRENDQNPFFFEINGWADPSSFGEGYKASDYADTVNTGGDIHIYPWLTNGSTDVNYDVSFIQQAVENFQKLLPTASGTMAPIIGEYGNSTIGQTVDQGGSQIVDAVNQTGYGSAAWWFGSGTADNLINADGSLTAFGQQVAAAIQAGGCPAAPELAFLSETPVPIPSPAPVALPMPPPAVAVAAPVTSPYQAPTDIPNTTVAPAEIPVTNQQPDVPKYTVGVPNLNLPVLVPLVPPPEADPAIKTLTAVVNEGMAMLASPIGTWLVKMDSSIVGGMDAALQGLAPELVAPVASMSLLFLGTRGIRIAQGDADALHNLWFNLVKIMLVVGLSTNLGNFDYYVRDFFYTNLPNFLTKAAGGQLVTDGLNGTAAGFDSIWAQTWVLIAKVYQEAGLLDFGSRLSAEFCGITVGVALMAMALVYLLARILLGIVIVLGPICIACTLFEQSKPIFERWMGKVIALTCLQLAGIVLLTMIFAADKDFMAQIIPATTAVGMNLGASGAPAPTITSDIQNLVSMVIWFGMGAFAMYALPAIAYSIGTGVATSMMPLALGLIGAAKAVSEGLSSLLGGAAAAGEAIGEMSLSFARDELTAGSSGLSLPPPPPPALSYATSPSFGE